MPPKKKSPTRQHKTSRRSKSKSPPRTAAAVGDKRRRSPSPKHALAAAGAPLTAPVTSAARTFGALLPSMLDLPSSFVETRSVGFTSGRDTTSLAEDRVVAWFPPYEDVAIIDNIEVRDVPLRAHPGSSFAFKLVINNAYARTHPEAVELLQNHTRVNAYINETREKLAFACTPLVKDGLVGVTVRISIPSDTDFQHVIISGVRVAGRPVIQFDFPFPRTVDVLPGMHAPLELLFQKNNAMDFAIASNGTMYVLFDSHATLVRVFAGDGTEKRRPMSVPIALVRTLVFVDTLNMLLFTTHDTLIAFDVERQSIRWQQTIVAGVGIICKPSVLSTCGVCIITSTKNEKHEVRVYSLDDGTLRYNGLTPYWCESHTFDSTTSTWYAFMFDEVLSQKIIVSFRWNGTKLIAEHTTPISESVRTITVIQPTAGRRISYLVGGHENMFDDSFILQVFSLPDLSWVCSTLIPCHWGKTLSADPSGTSIAMLNSYMGDAIHILPWPLAGMPALE
jgi:hypothetical protein